MKKWILDRPEEDDELKKVIPTHNAIESDKKELMQSLTKKIPKILLMMYCS